MAQTHSTAFGDIRVLDCNGFLLCANCAEDAEFHLTMVRRNAGVREVRADELTEDDVCSNCGDPLLDLLDL